MHTFVQYNKCAAEIGPAASHCPAQTNETEELMSKSMTHISDTFHAVVES